MHAHSASGLLALLVDEPTDYGEDGHKDDKRQYRRIHDSSFRLNRLFLLLFLKVLTFHCPRSFAKGTPRKPLSWYRE